MILSPRERWNRTLAYLQMKVDEADWHAVARTAEDLRVLEAEHPSLKQRSIPARDILYPAKPATEPEPVAHHPV